MGKNSTFKERIKGYSAMALASLGAGVANADIHFYNDVDPDQTISADGDTLSMDLNCDGVNDIRFSIARSSSVNPTSVYCGLKEGSIRNGAYFKILNPSMSVAGYSNQYGSKLATSFMVDNGLSWINYGDVSTNPGTLRYFSKTYFVTSPCGVQSSGVDNFKGEFNASGYLGFRIKQGSDTLYGWIRMNVNNKATSLTVYEAALNDVSGQGLLTGFNHVNDNGYPAASPYTPVVDYPNNQLIYADTAMAVVPIDSFDTDGAADMQVKFMVTDTAHTDSFRVFVAPTTLGWSMDLCDAWTFSNYKAFSSNHSSVTGSGPFYFNLNMAGAVDVQGNTIVNGVEYDVWVYSRARGANAEDNPDGSPGTVTRSNASSLVKSDSTVTMFGIAEPVVGLTAADIGNNKDASDLEVTFNEHSDITKNQEYHVIVVKGTKAGSFDLDSAQAVIPANYKTVAVGSASQAHTISYTASDVDSDGDVIQHCEEYQVFVLSTANGTTADRDSLVSSERITLYGQVAPAEDVACNDINDENAGQDLEYKFTRATDDEGIQEYRVFAVPIANLPFTASDAMNNDNYITNYPGPIKKFYSGNFKGVTDVNGDPIGNGNSYSICVLSVADMVCDTISTVSLGDTCEINTFFPKCIDSVNVIAFDSLDNNNAGDIYVEFSTDTIENIGDFYVLVVNSSTAGDPDIENILSGMISSGNFSRVDIDSYQMVGSEFKYSSLLNPNAGDENGDPISPYRNYNVYIVSEGDNIKSFANCYSGMSDTVSLVDYTGTEKDLKQNVNIYSYDNNVNIFFDKSIKLEGTITLFNSLGQAITVRNIDDYKIEISDVAQSGVYVVAVRTGNALITQKVFISRK